MISNVITRGLYKRMEVKRAFHISIDFVNRACRIYKAEGKSGFFIPENRHGYCYTLIGENLVLAQKLLDQVLNNCEVGR